MTIYEFAPNLTGVSILWHRRLCEKGIKASSQYLQFRVFDLGKDVFRGTKNSKNFENKTRPVTKRKISNTDDHGLYLFPDMGNFLT